MAILFGSGTLVGANTFVSSITLSNPTTNPSYIAEEAYDTSNWILKTGSWNDSGLWEDGAAWID